MSPTNQSKPTFGIIHYRAPGDTLEQFLDYAAQTGFDTVELAAKDIWPDGEQSPQTRAEHARRLLEQRGLAASALATGNDFVLLEEEPIRGQIERMEQFSRLAVTVGAPVLRTEGGIRKKEVPPHMEGRAIGECLKRCVAFAERDNISLAVDNHGLVTNDPAVLFEALEIADSPRMGSNLDTANFHWAGHSVQTCRDLYDRVAPRVQHVHLKDCTGTHLENSYVGTVQGEGNVDLLHAVAALRRAGYDGAYTAEWEGPADQDGREAYARCLEWMRANITR